jgi:tetratricopeptide (TPR) repeat protein
MTAMRHTKRYIMLGLVAIFALAGLLPAKERDLPPVPEPAVEGFSRPVQEQLRAARAQLLEAPRDAGRNLQLGRLLHAYQMLPPAILCYQRARLLQPGDFAAAYLLGIAQAQSGDDAGATANLRAALTIDPGFGPARLRLGEVLFKTGELIQARALFEVLLAQQPDSAWGHYRLAQVLSALGDVDGAINHNRRAIEIYEDFGPAHYALALAYRDQGDTRLAQTHMGRYDANPEQTPPHDDSLLEALEMFDISAQTQVRRAMQLERAGQESEALRALQQAVAVEPQSVEAHSQLVRLYHRLNDVEGAQQHYRAVTVLQPNAIMANIEYGSLLAEQGRFTDAAAAFEQALIADPDHSVAHTLLAQAREELEQTGEAERHYRLALDSDPNNRLAALLLGRLLMRADRRIEAEPYLKLAGQGDRHEHAFYLLRIAQVYHEAGERLRALSMLEQAHAQATAQGQQPLLEEILLHRMQWQEGQ